MSDRAANPVQVNPIKPKQAQLNFSQSSQIQPSLTQLNPIELKPTQPNSVQPNDAALGWFSATATRGSIPFLHIPLLMAHTTKVLLHKLGLTPLPPPRLQLALVFAQLKKIHTTKCHLNTDKKGKTGALAFSSAF